MDIGDTECGLEPLHPSHEPYPTIESIQPYFNTPHILNTAHYIYQVCRATNLFNFYFTFLPT